MSVHGLTTTRLHLALALLCLLTGLMTGTPAGLVAASALSLATAARLLVRRQLAPPTRRAVPVTRRGATVATRH